MGGKLISAGIVASTFGWLVLVIMVSPRVYQALAADGLFFEGFARLHPKFRTPSVALLFQGVWTCLLLATKKYGQLLDYVTFADWIFFGATAATLVVFRRRDQPGAAGAGFRVPGYPWTVVAFLGAAGYVVAGSILSNPGNALRGGLLLAIGVPVFLYWSGRRKVSG
jgi:APA family basic amino acid/polyamine antiporter